METRKITQYVYPYASDIPKLIEQGWEKVANTNNMFCKTEEKPAYSSQVKHKYIGAEPSTGGCVSSFQYHTYYYEVKRSDFEKMAVKPTLKKVVRSFRAHNFDGFVEITQRERIGKGWEEVSQTFYEHTTYVYFVVD